MSLRPEQQAKADERCKDSRALIYKNLLNGVPVSQVMKDYCKSEKEVLDVFQYVSRKINDYLFRKCKPHVLCTSIGLAQKSRIKLLEVLPNINLDILPIYKDITHELVTTDNIERTFRELRS